MQILISIVNDAGLRFNVRLVRRGERYGRNLCLVHDKDDPLVEFYDARYPHTEIGQFITRYYRSTLMKPPHDRGLCLDGGVPDWRINATAFEAVLHSLEEA
jgi:hypothetical protein